jgi:hypothetical protein
MLANKNKRIARLHIEANTHDRPSVCNETSDHSTRAHRLVETSLYQSICPRPRSPNIGLIQPVAKYLRDIYMTVIPSIGNWEWPKHVVNGPNWAAGLCKTRCASKANATRAASPLAIYMRTIIASLGPPISCISIPSKDTGDDKSSLADHPPIKRVQRGP